jgi:hypothetical protein
LVPDQRPFLRNVLEFLIKSSNVAGNHKRFENGSYRSLRLSGSYLVVDIVPWDSMPDFQGTSDK